MTLSNDEVQTYFAESVGRPIGLMPLVPVKYTRGAEIDQQKPHMGEWVIARMAASTGERLRPVSRKSGQHHLGIADLAAFLDPHEWHAPRLVKPASFE